MELKKLTPKERGEVVLGFHKLIIELITKYDSPETIYLMARALSITAIMKAEKDYYGFLTMQNALSLCTIKIIITNYIRGIDVEDGK